MSATTRPLITFAFVKDEFDRTGDIVRGLIPLFAPIFDQMAGKTFSPTNFAQLVEKFYGLRMHPWVAEDWATRFEEAGFLQGSGDKYSRSYMCVASPKTGNEAPAAQVSEMLDGLVSHVMDLLSNHGLAISKADVEDGVIGRLTTPDFLHLLLKPNLARANARTLSLPGTTSSQTPDKEAVLDFALASRIIELSEYHPAQFDIVSRVAAGALVSEIVLNLRNPPSVGQRVSGGSVVYLDSPFVIDLLDLGDRQQHLYAKSLAEDLKSAGAILRTFEHNLQEIQGILTATLENHNDVNAAVGTVAYRTRTDGTARSRAQAIKVNLDKKVRELGVTPVALENATRNREKYFPDAYILDLTAQIRPFGDIFSREVDAWSIAGVARQVLSVKPVANVMSLSATFVTKNAGLARAANKFLHEQCNYSAEAASPFLTDRQAAGLMWLALGGAAGDLAKRQLLANCASAVTPRRDVLSAVYQILEETDPKAARDFEVLMTEDRCAHYVMESALGDVALVTADNALEILEEVKRRAVEDVAREYDEKRRGDLADAAARHEASVAQMQTIHAEEVEGLQQAAEARRAELASEMAERESALSSVLGELEAKSRNLGEQEHQLSSAQDAIQELQRGAILRCASKARIYGRNIRVGIVLGTCTLLATLGIALSYASGKASGVTLLILTVSSVFVVAGLSALISWVVPDIVFKKFITRQMKRKFDHEIQAQGAAGYLSDWSVDLEAGSADLKR